MTNKLFGRAQKPRRGSHTDTDTRDHKTGAIPRDRQTGFTAEQVSFVMS